MAEHACALTTPHADHAPARGPDGAAVLLIFGRNRLVAATGALLVLILVAILLSHTRASRPVAGATYTGTANIESSRGRIVQRAALSFTVDPSGRRVADLRFSAGLPHSCESRSIVSPAPLSAPITGDRFSARVPIRRDGSQIGTLSVAGTFQSQGQVTGAVSTRFSAPGLGGCGIDATLTGRS